MVCELAGSDILRLRENVKLRTLAAIFFFLNLCLLIPGFLHIFFYMIFLHDYMNSDCRVVQAKVPIRDGTT